MTLNLSMARRGIALTQGRSSVRDGQTSFAGESASTPASLGCIRAQSTAFSGSPVLAVLGGPFVQSRLTVSPQRSLRRHTLALFLHLCQQAGFAGARTLVAVAVRIIQKVAGVAVSTLRALSMMHLWVVLMRQYFKMLRIAASAHLALVVKVCSEWLRAVDILPHHDMSQRRFPTTKGNGAVSRGLRSGEHPTTLFGISHDPSQNARSWRYCHGYPCVFN